MAVSYHLPSSNLLEHFMPLLCLVTLLLTSSRRQKPSGRHLLIFVLPNLYTHLHMSFSVLFGKYPSFWGFPGGAVVKNTPANAGHSEDMGSISRLGRSPGGGNGNPLQYSCLENSTGRGTWQATMHGVSKRLCESPESPQLHTAHSIPPSVNSSALTFHWILALIFFLLQAFLLCLLPSPCLIDIFLTSRSVCEIRLKSLGPLFFSIICSIPVFLIITLL